MYLTMKMIFRFVKKVAHIWAFVCVLSMIFVLDSCMPPVEKKVSYPTVQDFSIPIVNQVYALQNAQKLDSLLFYIQSENQTAKFNALRAFGSFQSKDAIPFVKQLLLDSNEIVQGEAAYVAGQLNDPSLANDVLNAFKPNTENRVNSTINLHVLEAIGKIGSATQLKQLSEAKLYKKSYDTLNYGKALAYFHFGGRGIKHPKVTEQMVKMVTEDYPGNAKVIASVYLSRYAEALNPFKFQLLQAFKKEKNPEIRMHMLSALTKVGATELFPSIVEAIEKDPDNRVRVAGIQQLHKFPYIKTIDKVLQWIKSENYHVSMAATDFLRNHGKASDASFYLRNVQEISNPYVQYAMYGAVLKLIENNYQNTRYRIEQTLKKAFEETEDLQIKRAIISALGSNLNLHQKMISIAQQDSNAVVYATAVEQIGQLMTSYLPQKGPRTRRIYQGILAKHLQVALKERDAGIASAVGYAVLGLDEKDKAVIDVNDLKEAYGHFKMPIDLEAMHTLSDAINYLDPTAQYSKEASTKVYAIDTSMWRQIPDTLTALVKTNRGSFSITLFKRDAFSTVYNFYRLAQEQYFNNKPFHRVVSNFVIQTGCPRGDGYGGPSYTLPSNLSPEHRYISAGYVGMASVGPHTEGTQWFVTLAATPHLNGRYTIFGKVDSGMDVVQNIQLGDIIESITF